MNAKSFELVRSLVREQAAIILDPGKEYLVEARLAPLAKSLGHASIDAMVAELSAPGAADLREQVVEAMTTNETSFFRDRTPFDVLWEQVIPEMLEARATTRSLSIWCGASSTGQEPYSIAMTLLEHFPQLQTWKVEITATDLSQEVLSRAREGLYSQLEVNRGVTPELLEKYFTKEGNRWRVCSKLRDLVKFQQMNLSTPWPSLPPADVVFLRNVLIYFDKTVKQQILDGVRRVLRPDGYLFLGAAESTLGLTEEYDRVTFGKATCYQSRSTAPAR